MTDFTQLHCPMSYSVYKFQPEVGEFSACCDAWPYKFNEDAFIELGNEYFTKFPKLIERKQSLYDNIKHVDCETCWKKEERGILSMRQHHGPTYNKLLNNRTPPTDTAFPSRIELWMNSTCNLGCFMCWIGNSNTLRKIWYKDYDTNGSDGRGYENYLADSRYYKGEHKQQWTNAVIDFTKKSIRECQHIMTIAYLGGEPTLHDEMYDHADEFIEAGRESIAAGKTLTIEITTNGTSKDKLNERFYNMFKKYKTAGWQTKIMLSQDGAHDQVMVRHGADFNQIQKNFGNWIKPDSVVDNVRSFTVVTGLNLPYIDQMAQYINDTIRSNYVEGKRHRVEIAFNALQDPEWMQTAYLPKKYAIEKIKKAHEIFKQLASDYHNVYYEDGYFASITSDMPDSLTPEQAEFFFSKINYVNKQYQKTYPTWDFFTTFPHLKELANDCNIERQ